MISAPFFALCVVMRIIVVRMESGVLLRRRTHHFAVMAMWCVQCACARIRLSDARKKERNKKQCLVLLPHTAASSAPPPPVRVPPPVFAVHAVHLAVQQLLKPLLNYRHHHQIIPFCFACYLSLSRCRILWAAPSSLLR